MKLRNPESASAPGNCRVSPTLQSLRPNSQEDIPEPGRTKSQYRPIGVPKKAESNRAKRLRLRDETIIEQKSIEIIWTAFHYYAPLKKLYTYVTENPAEGLLLRHAASIAAMSRTYFAEYFHQSTGVTFKYWIDFMRVTRAANFLKSSNMSIIQVADECGFSDPTTFTRTFRRIRGITPLGFRHDCEQSLMLPPPQSPVRSEHLPKQSE